MSRICGGSGYGVVLDIGVGGDRSGGGVLERGVGVVVEVLNCKSVTLGRIYMPLYDKVIYSYIVIWKKVRLMHI